MKLRNTIFRGYILAVLIPIVMTCLFLYIYSKRVIEDNAMREVGSIASGAINDIDRFMHERLTDVKTWRQLGALRDYSSSNAHDRSLLKDELYRLNKENPLYHVILLVDSQGRIVEGSNPGIISNPDASALLDKEKWYSKARANDAESFHSDIIFSSLLSRNSIVFVSRIHGENGTNKGMIVGYVDAMFLYEIVESVVISTRLQEENGFIAVYGENGLLFLAPEFQRKAEYANIVKNTDKILPELSDARRITIEGSDYLVGLSGSSRYNDNLGRDWHVVVFLNEGIALSKVTLLRTLLFIVVVIVIGASIFIARHSSGQISQPINLLTRKVQELSANLGNVSQVKIEDLKSMFDSDAQDEVKKLFAAIAKMVEVIKFRTTEVEKYRCEAVENARLVAIGQTASQIAHDVRRPLSALKAMLTVLPENRNDDEFLREFSASVERTIGSTNRMLSEILEFSKDAGSLMRRDLDPQIAITSALSEVLRSCGESSIAVSYFLNHHNCLNVDSDRIIRVLTNIIGNAVEAMKSKGMLWFKTEEVGSQGDGVSGRIRIVVGNDGPVISEAVQAKIFEPFYTTGKKGGTGLGLSICQKIVEMHYGSIAVSSSEGKTEFTIDLSASTSPAACNERDLIDHSDELKPFRDEAEKRDEYGDLENIKEILRICKAKGTKLNLLIVDDEPLFRETLRGLINMIPQVRDNISIVELSSAEEALKLLNSCSFDYVITDIDMGPYCMNGYEFSRKVLEICNQSYVLIHSNKRMEELDKAVRKSLNDRFMGFLPKPMQQTELIQFLARKSFEIAASVSDGHALEKRRVLILNDDEDVQLSMKMMIKSPDVEIFCAGTVQDAENVVYTKDVDVVLSDINLGCDQPDGYVFLEHIRENNDDLKIYMVSGNTAHEEESKAIHLGADGYLQLPVELDQLRRAIRS